MENDTTVARETAHYQRLSREEETSDVTRLSSA